MNAPARYDAIGRVRMRLDGRHTQQIITSEQRKAAKARRQAQRAARKASRK